MKKICFIFMLIGSVSISYCQTFQGTVYDSSTNRLLTGAVIFINGTTNGTYSDINGFFSLNISEYNSMPITISFLGYSSVTLSEYSSNKHYDIRLAPKIIELKEVVVKPTVDYLKIFIKEFLGETENASECKILNEHNLRFIYNNDSRTLSVHSLEPIIIHNKALAYNITYYLEKFSYTKVTDENKILTEKMVLLGNYIFKDELSNLSRMKKLKVEKRREQAFYDSRMHFFRQLYKGKFTQAGNAIIIPTEDKLSPIENVLTPYEYLIRSDSVIKPDSFVVKNDSISGYLKHTGKLFVTKKSKEKGWEMHTKTVLDLQTDSLYFKKNGFFDPNAVTFEGEMSKQRIGDQLPFEYSVK